MDTFEITEMKPHYIGQMAKKLRKDHAKMVLELGQNSHRSLLTYYSQSFFSRAWKVNGKLAAIGGITGSILSSEGFVWLAFTEEALKYPIAIIKEAKIQLNEIMNSKFKLFAFVLSADKIAQRFAEFLGFDCVGPVDDDFLIYTLTAEE